MSVVEAAIAQNPDVVKCAICLDAVVVNIVDVIIVDEFDRSGAQPALQFDFDRRAPIWAKN